MTGEEFVKLCYEEKEATLHEYFNKDSESQVANEIRKMILSGVNEKDLYSLINMIMSESYYTLMLGLDGEASLGGKQITYKLYDDNNVLLNECGEIEESVYSFFNEEQ